MTAPAAAVEPRTGRGASLAQLARAPWDAIATAGLVASAAVFVWQVPWLFDRSDGLAWMATWQLWVVGWLLVVTATSRTLGLRLVVSLFLAGFYGVTALVRLVGVPVGWVVEQPESTVNAVVVAPLLEEPIKALPLVLVALGALANRRRLPSVAGFGILGFAVGAGFDWYETSLARSAGAGGPGLNPLSWAWPTAFFDGGGVVVVHSGWTALVGLAIGFAVTRWHQPVARLAPLAALAVVMVDHAAANAMIADEYTVLWWLTLRGWGTFALLVGGFAVGFVVDRRVLRDGDERDRRFRRPTARQLTGLSGGPGGVRPLACWTYLRSRNGAHQLLAARAAAGRLDRVDPGLARQLEGLRIRAGLEAGGGEPGPAGGPGATGAAAPATEASSSPAWHGDPTGRHELRWWDGTAWTAHVSDAGTTSADPLPGDGPPSGAEGGAAAQSTSESNSLNSSPSSGSSPTGT